MLARFAVLIRILGVLIRHSNASGGGMDASAVVTWVLGVARVWRVNMVKHPC